ncbi:MAG: hypothetical protein ACYTGB_05750 [Planctomycetota bacterium]|jgi:hypothetical protein
MVRHRAEKPKPVGTIIGVVVCLGLIGGFLILVNQGVIKGSNKQANQGGEIKVVRTPSGGVLPAPGPGLPTPIPVPVASGEVRVSFTGGLTETGDTRKIVYKCPHPGCGKEVREFGSPNCLSCAKGIKWPQKVSCGFCSASGKCGACKGEGKCPVCGKGPRMLMGVRPPCNACNTTGKCPACDTSGKCEHCESGTYYPGQPKSTPKPATQEDPPIPKPKPE